jgi:predicted nucleic acid-binding protein
MRVYLDACCLNRLTDDHSQVRIRNEAEAVERILRMIGDGKAIWVSSNVLEIEISRNPDPERRRDVQSLLRVANEIVVPDASAAGRAASLRTLGFGTFDALHLASAEQGKADVLLTTDDGLVRRAQRYSLLIPLRVENPLFWYQEIES